jgi:exonuclease VII small subunit
MCPSGDASTIASRTKLEFELHSSGEQYQKMTIMAKHCEGKLKAKEEELRDLQSKVR